MLIGTLRKSTLSKKVVQALHRRRRENVNHNFPRGNPSTSTIDEAVKEIIIEKGRITIREVGEYVCHTSNTFSSSEHEVTGIFVNQ